ncbi:MAG TPA: 4-hydroxy-tetrahydrodipicolinate reductase [Bacteroidota bacterium]|nr:4-hydroxy-tetrahydrodipicolinate reductase [Bacteroidota bacterium]
MKIILLGYGRMGRDVEQAALERGHSIVARYDINAPLPAISSLPPALQGAECAIDFSAPDATEHHIRSLGPLHIPLVVGTTGWNDRLPALLEFIRQCKGTILYASNFSVGANIFSHAAAETAKLINRFSDYDIAIHEIHHKMKKDAPSGTALTLAKTILQHVQRKTEIITALNNRQIRPNELLVSSSRIGDVAGTHSVTFESPADAIQLTHTAHNRRGFALGAVWAAEWLQGRSGIFTMEDFLFKT